MPKYALLAGYKKLRDVVIVYKDYGSIFKQVPKDEKINLDQVAKYIDHLIGQESLELTKVSWRKRINDAIIASTEDESKVVNYDDILVINMEDYSYDIYSKPYGTEI